MKPKEKVVIILSGGVDSTTLLYQLIHLNYEVYAVSFDYVQKHARELLFARKTCTKLDINHKILNLSVLNEVAPSALTRKDIKVPEGHYEEENMKLTVVPNRNMVMLSIAVAYAIGIKATKVYYGAHMGDRSVYPDCRPEFINVMKSAIQLCDWSQIELVAPFVSLRKEDIVKLGLKLKVPYEETWSCYSPKENGRPCLKCGTDVERTEAFLRNGIRDPLLTSEEWREAVRYYRKGIAKRFIKRLGGAVK